MPKKKGSKDIEFSPLLKKCIRHISERATEEIMEAVHSEMDTRGLEPSEYVVNIETEQFFKKEEKTEQ